MSEKSYSDLKAYLRRLGWSLASLPERDRDDIVEETRLHVLGRVEQGRSIGDALATLGPAESYARSFIDEMELAGALAGQRLLPSLRLLMRRAHLNAQAAIAVVAVGALFVLGLMGAIGVVAKPFDPLHVGLWTSARGALFVGAAGPGFVGREWLGNWIYPVGGLDVIVTWVLGRRIVTWGAQALAQRREFQ